MLHLSSSLQKTSHNIIILLKKNHHSIISNSCSFLIQSSPQINKTNSNQSKRSPSNYINQNSIKTSQKEPLRMSGNNPKGSGCAKHRVLFSTSRHGADRLAGRVRQDKGTHKMGSLLETHTKNTTNSQF